jgi:hypothetical protein
VVAERLQQRAVDATVDGRQPSEVLLCDGADPGDVLLLIRGEAAHGGDGIAP